MIEIKHIFFQCISKLMSSKQLFSSSDVNYIDIVLPRPLLRGWDISFVFVLVFRFQLFCVFTHYLLFRSGAGFRPICLYCAAYQGSFLADMLSFTFVLFSVCDSRQLPLAFVSNSSDLLPAYWSSSRCRSLHTAAKFTDSETFQLTTRAFLRFNFSLYWWDFFKLKTELFGV